MIDRIVSDEIPVSARGLWEYEWIVGFSKNILFRREGSLLDGISYFGKKSAYEMRYGIRRKNFISAREFF